MMLVTRKKEVQEILGKLQKHSKSYIIGGYLRDSFVGVEPDDIDLATEIPIDSVGKIFPQLRTTEQGKELGIGRFMYKNIQFEISTYTNNDFISSLKKRDFKLNSMYHDGENLFDLYDAKKDIDNKVISSLQEPSIHFKEHPQAYLRAIRLASKLGFSIDEKLFNFMKTNVKIFHENTENRIQQEGYKIIASNYPLIAIDYLIKLGFIQATQSFNPYQKIDFLNNNIPVKVAYLCSIVGVNTIYEFIDLFLLSKKLKEKLYSLIPFLDDTSVPSNPYLFNEVLLLKKHMYQNEPEKLKNFLINVRNNKK
jgi:tRNA nucleotidyltransferase/poly(A) polymerase